MKKITVIFSIFAILLLLVSCSEKEVEKSDTTAFTVNGEAVTTEELEYFKSRCKADIINEYAEKYAIADFSDFWDKDFNGSTPSQILEEKATENAIEAKIKLVLMRDNGIYDDISFSALKKKARKFNDEHSDSIGNVGINTIDISTFYTYYISTGEMELKTILGEKELKPKEDELKSASEENPETSKNGLTDIIVSKKYDELIKEKIKNAIIKQ